MELLGLIHPLLIIIALDGFSSMSISEQTANAGQITPRRKLARSVLAAVIIVVVVLASFAVYALSNQTSVPIQTAYPSPQTTTGVSPNPVTTGSPNSSLESWMTKGAYATYAGDASVMGFGMDFAAKLTVVDLNTTHARIETDINASTLFGNYVNQTSKWIDKATLNFQPGGLNLTRSYNAQVTVPDLGTRNTIVYEYASEGMNVTFYVDASARWPIKISLGLPLFEGETYTINMMLTETNIAGL